MRKINLLAVDVGNTNISFGLFISGHLVTTFHIPTCTYNPGKIRNKLKKKAADDAVICSVVPGLTNRIAKDLKAITGKLPYIIGKDIKVPLKNLYRKPNQVGEDRLVNAYAATIIYGAPIIAVDFGTAITFDVISGKKEYLGGMIIPGLKISLEALHQRTALLPLAKLEKPRDFIGRDTKNSMLSGIIYGFSSLTDDLIMRIRKAIGRNTLSIATGGNIRLISRYCRQLDKVDINLTLKGLNMLYFNFNKKNT
ncbi:MAG: type III pantothenate kinase [Candidatus Omnitrophica bacterium]|nr:type III pantothenate kinase [Candidatus Omnitrophota bacterium]